MTKLELGVEVELTDGPAVPVEQHGAVVKLYRPATGDYELLLITDVAARLAVRARVPERLLQYQSMPPESAGEVDRLAAHVREVATGQPLEPGGARRPEYDPATTVASRVRLKLKELQAEGVEMSERTFRRKLSAFGDHGTAGVVDGRTTRKQTPLGRADERVIQTLTRLMAEQTDQTTRTLDALLVQLKQRLLAEYPGAALQPPSRVTLSRWIKQLDPNGRTLGSAKSRRSHASRPDRFLEGRPAAFPGAEIQIDSTPLDAFIRHHDGTVERVTLTLAVDKATRSIVGHMFVPVATKGVDLGFLLAQMLVPAPLRPGHAALQERPGPDLPELIGDASELERRRPFIVPRRILVDNGADYSSSTFVSACEMFDIDITWAKPGTGSDKGVVEASFRSVNAGFVQHLPGYLGRSPEMRGRHPERDALLDLVALDQAFETWVNVVYQNAPHDGLRDPWLPAVKHSPNSMYQALVPLTGTIALPHTEETYLALLPKVERVIQPDGIMLNYRRYDSPMLHPYRDSRHPVTGKRKWDIRYDPYNPMQVWVETPDGDWLECEWMNENALTRPFADTVFTNARQAREVLGVLGHEAGHEFTSHLVKATQAHQKQRARDERRRASAAARKPAAKKTQVVTHHTPTDIQTLPDLDTLLDAR